MKTVTRMDSLSEQERTAKIREHQELLQQSVGMVKLDGQYLKEINVMVSADDLTAFRRYREEVLDDGKRRLTGMEVIYDMLLNRNQLDELVITESSLLSPLHVRLDTELYETLKEEAAQHKISLSDYIRSIMYGLGHAAAKRRSDNTKRELEFTQYKRHIQVPFFISPEQRERMFQKHGNMTDDQLVRLAQKQFHDVLLK